MEAEFSKSAPATAVVQSEKPKALKLTFNEQRALEKLPIEIEALEAKTTPRAIPRWPDWFSTPRCSETRWC